MIIRDEKSELLQLIHSIPAENFAGFGYGVSVGNLYKAFRGPKERAEFLLCQMEKSGEVELFRKPELGDMILVVRAC